MDLRQFGITDLQDLISDLEPIADPAPAPQPQLPSDDTPAPEETPSNEISTPAPQPESPGVASPNPASPEVETPVDADSGGADTDASPETGSSQRAWDAVAYYAGDNNSLLAPKVEEIKMPDPPMPHMKSEAWLRAEGFEYEVDMERSNQNEQLELKDKPDGFLSSSGRSNPDGFIVNIPPGEYEIQSMVLKVRRSLGFNFGARFIFRGQIGEGGTHPKITILKGGFFAGDSTNLELYNAFSGMEVENIELTSPDTGLDAGPGTFIRYFRYENVLFSGGFKNPSHPTMWPMIGVYNNVVFARGGRGDGLTHSFYGSYVQSLICRNCLWTSPNKAGHPLKIYAENIDIQGSTIASWWHTKDRDENFYGDQSPIDIGTRGQSIIANCHIIRRGNSKRTRNTPFVDYRNRTFEKGVYRYTDPDWGTDAAEVDYHTIDNEVGSENEINPSSDKLYRHVLLNNKLFNGVMPDGSLDDYIADKPGFIFRHNGSIYEWADGLGSLDSSDASFRLTPTDYGLRNERAVIYADGNSVEGVPVMEEYPGPYQHDQDPHPTIHLEGRRPDWILERLQNSHPVNQWWSMAWTLSSFHP